MWPSGVATKSERHGVGEEEFAPWTIGPTLRPARPGHGALWLGRASDRFSSTGDRGLWLVVELAMAGLVPDRSHAVCQQRWDAVGHSLRRGWLAAQGVPAGRARYDVRTSRFLGIGLKELSHVENLPQRMPIVLAAGLIAAAAVGLGDLVLRAFGWLAASVLGERMALDFGLGARALGRHHPDRRDGWAGSTPGRPGRAWACWPPPDCSRSRLARPARPKP